MIDKQKSFLMMKNFQHEKVLKTSLYFYCGMCGLEIDKPMPNTKFLLSTGKHKNKNKETKETNC